MATMPVTRQKSSLSSSIHIPKLTSTNGSRRRGRGGGRRAAGARSRTPSPAAAMELVRAKRVEVPMTFQSVSENSPPSSGVAGDDRGDAERADEDAQHDAPEGKLRQHGNIIGHRAVGLQRLGVGSRLNRRLAHR